MKKLLLPLLALISMNSFAQTDSATCAKYVSYKYDEMTGKGYHYSKGQTVSDDGGKTGFALNLMLTSSNTTIFTILAVGGGSCIDENNTVLFLFTDSTRLEIKSNGSFNCKNETTIYLGESWGPQAEEYLKILTTKTIKAMRVRTHDSSVQKYFTAEQAKQFRITLSCISKK